MVFAETARIDPEPCGPPLNQEAIMTYDANSAYGSGSPLSSDLDGAKSPDDLSRPLYGATFGQAVRRFFKKFSVFSGRASRSEYWFAYLFTALLMLVPTVLYVIGISMVTATAASSSYSPYGTPTAEPSATAEPTSEPAPEPTGSPASPGPTPSAAPSSQPALTAIGDGVPGMTRNLTVMCARRANTFALAPA